MRKDLSEDIIKQIEYNNRVRDLEDGYFYDGCNIRNDEGLIVKHPSI